MSQSWTVDEVKYVNENQGKKSCAAMGEKLGRSKDSVQKKIRAMRKKSGKMPDDTIAKVNEKLIRENKKLANKLSDALDMEHVFVDSFKKALSDADPIPTAPTVRFYKSKTQKDKHTCNMGIEFSDLQMGMFIKPEDTIFLGGYNFEIFKERLDKFRDVIITIAEENRRVRQIDDLIIFGLGDYVEGEQIFPSQGLFIDKCVADQFVEGVNAISTFLRDLSAHFKNVRLYGVWGNHGRLGRFAHGHQRSNMDYLLLKTLQMRCEPVKNLKIHVSTGPVMAVQIFDRIHLLRHGDDTCGWMGIPFYGMERDTLKYANLLRATISDAHVGHHHRQASWEVSAMKIHMNGSFCGPTPFGIHKLKAADLPSQSVFILHPEHGMTWRAPIWLEKPMPLKMDDTNGIFTPYS